MRAYCTWCKEEVDVKMCRDMDGIGSFIITECMTCAYTDLFTDETCTTKYEYSPPDPLVD